MAFVSELFGKAKDMANSFLNGSKNMPPRTSYYVDDEDGMAYQQPQQQPEQQQPYRDMPYQPQQQQQTTYQQPQQPMQQPYQGQPYQQSFQQPAQPKYRTQASYQDQQPVFEQPQVQSQQPNVAFFPNTGFQDGSTGESFSHVERVVQMVSREDMQGIVEFMMNRESVIISCESIASAPEVQRCFDLVSGAAYALGFQITQLSLASKVFLLSPANVMVICDEASNRINGRGSDGTPLRTRRSQRGTAPTASYGEYQEYQPQQEYQDPYEQQPYQYKPREGYGRPTYQSASM